MTIDFQLQGKVALVTGGATGIGFGAANALVDSGAAVVVVGIEAAAIGEAVSALGPERASGAVADVRDSGAVSDAIDHAVERFGRLDIVVNSAAVQPYGTVETMAEDDWDRTIDINLKGAYLTSHHAIPHLRRAGGGSIVHIASVQGVANQTNVAVYVASKGGLLALTRAMALDHAGDSIRVNSICPGSVDTPMLRFAASENLNGRTEDEVIATWCRQHPLGRVGTADEVGAMVAYLCSPAAAFCTGAEFRVDGGLLAKLGVVLPD